MPTKSDGAQPLRVAQVYQDTSNRHSDPKVQTLIDATAAIRQILDDVKTELAPSPGYSGHEQRSLMATLQRIDAAITQTPYERFDTGISSHDNVEDFVDISFTPRDLDREGCSWFS